jgi:RNase P subunit RPR2
MPKRGRPKQTHCPKCARALSAENVRTYKRGKYTIRECLHCGQAADREQHERRMKDDPTYKAAKKKSWDNWKKEQRAWKDTAPASYFFRSA